ncbi:unnamed protein product (macronuclear) [Paramecium tetraurelia]|uniref:C2 NT-type domain-containing protein n=1 Tax=Paramecium tetraurelia TaxID=5888 RepID=A0D1W3_PARTE|nr:uncharacterized protein GSPATT00012555001 [Paramecium tetraurelia]CAK77030.1 unnamed protein product [Paramecium tetraurelia]|eukprot:XP_001444427.1 hypothetical protein (macronuclear) [Paramecium tetraurelia strain d4-2]
MLQINVEVQTVYFYIDSPITYCHMQLNDSVTAVMLNSQLKCKCYEQQDIYEKAEIRTPYDPKNKKKLKLIFFENQSKFGEAVFDLDFYIENKFQQLSDKLSIQSEQNEEAQLTFMFEWQFIEKPADNNPKIINPYLSGNSPQNTQRNVGQSPKRLAQSKKIGDENEKRTTHVTYSQWKDHKEYLKNQLERKLKEPKHPQKVVIVDDCNYNWSDTLRKPDAQVRVVSPPKRFGTPTKTNKKFQSPTNTLNSQRQQDYELRMINEKLSKVDKQLQQMNNDNKEEEKKKYSSKLNQKLKQRQCDDYRNGSNEEHTNSQSEKGIKQRSLHYQSFVEQKDSKDYQFMYNSQIQPPTQQYQVSDQLIKSLNDPQTSKQGIKQNVSNLDFQKGSPKPKELQQQLSQRSKTQQQEDLINNNQFNNYSNNSDKYDELMKKYLDLKDKYQNSCIEFSLLSTTYNQLKDEYTQVGLQNQQYQKQIAFLQQQQLINGNNEQNNQSAFNQEIVKKELEFLQRDNNMLKSQLDQSQYNVNQLQKEKEKNQIEIYNLKNNLLLINQEIEKVQNDAMQMKIELKQNSQTQQGSEGYAQLNIKSDSQLINQLKAQLESQEFNAIRSKEELELLKIQYQELEKENLNQKKQIGNFNQIIQSLEDEITKLKEQLEEKKQDIIRTQALNNKDNIGDIIDGYKQVIKKKEQEILDQEEGIKEMKKQIQVLEQELQSESELKQEIEQKLNKKVNDLSEDIEKLQSDNQYLRQMMSQTQNEQQSSFQQVSYLHQAIQIEFHILVRNQFQRVQFQRR